MKIIIVIQGSQGDVNPFFSLGIILKASGHKVIFAAPDGFKQQYIKYGFEHIPVGFDFKMKPEEANGKYMFSQLKKSIEDQFEILINSIKDADLIIGNGLDFAGSSISEKFGTPHIAVLHVPPAFKSDSMAPISVKNRNLPRIINKIHWKVGNLFIMILFGKWVNIEREKLSLPKFKNYCELMTKGAILSAAKSLAPMPPEYSNVFRTGYWVLDDGDELDGELENFINAGEPPIYIGFGSMIDQDSQKTSQILNKLISLKDYRFVISRGWANLTAQKNENVYFVDYVPHVKLFPKMSMTIHHGGAGTTHTSAKAGVPQILVPHALDQYYWADRIYKLKLGPKPLQRRKLTFQGVKISIDEVLKNPIYKENAAKVAKEINAEDSIGDMVKYIEEKVGVMC
ncbi:glycosyltransferase [Pseudobacteroides cellulosolvens]|uniref:UDP-glucuronosyl/UDP-glucosyltransferase n=1 Tax=Pseudobacteroides cellulosolvens ATCC 35603 = DSM 2933 TaxID=398512 RepID=A0A0L6JJV3_9FIRM|nr:glycosyltransferase [Pseudobacteroides cellulosolvens]KNY26161.1 UDP-glucuronosyl/UDP-glucosyltransferase [Pseudobacteroides cellulosolvens ATCC 35603 = DSM 2933]